MGTRNLTAVCLMRGIWHALQRVSAPEDDRFYFLKRDAEEVYGVRKIAGWSFDALLTDQEFLEPFKVR